uniref:Protein kinase domain-containing protein n=2 Tax=Rhodosorus marinus TaxID=101924 RepID=A0A7S3EJX3_9RHOD|mmetsp:Transcript_39513/g.156933  ORF Transcript_39513/g.156933 Transcript_39513/m.156933 type:complete len:589 (+) Transcript_39513:345-2111(+)
MWRKEPSPVGDADRAPPRKTYPQAASGYDLKEQIGKGSAATVFKAWCEQEHEEVAIKVIDLEWFQASLDDIWKEIQVMSLSSHPNVVPYSTSFVDGTYLWVVMPLLTGGSVQSLLNGMFPGGMPEPLTQYLLFETVKALDYFHKHGQIHRDVKAANILLTSQGQVMLSDYGVMGWMVEGGVERKLAQTVVGTPHWMAPEVLEQRHGYNYKADIWSLGITALELAQGHPPYVNYPPVKIMLMTLNEPPPQLTGQPSFEYSKAFKEMVQLCLQKDPKRRASTSDLLHHRFFRNVKKPDDLPELLSRLPPLGSRAGSQAMLYRLLRKGKSVGSRGESESQSKGSNSLVWDFDIGNEAENVRFDESRESLNGVESTTTKSSTDNLSKPPTPAPIPPSSPKANTPKPPSRVVTAALTSSPSTPRPKRAEEKAGDDVQNKTGAVASTNADASTVPVDTTKSRKSRFTISEVELSKASRGEAQDAEEQLRANASEPLLDGTEVERNSSRRPRIEVKEVLKDDPSIAASAGSGLVGENASTHSGGNFGPTTPMPLRSLASQDNLTLTNLPKLEGDTEVNRPIPRKVGTRPAHRLSP